MKKCIISLLFVLPLYNVVAQDTVRYPDHWYGYTPREALMEFTGPDHTTPGSMVEVWANESYNYKYCSTYPQPDKYIDIMKKVEPGVNQKLYGIAVTMDPDVIDTLGGKLLIYRGVSMVPQPSLLVSGADRPYMYYGNVDSFYTIPFNDPPLMKECVFEYDYSLPTVRSFYSNCYEFYLDEPLDLSTNNTYIGITQCGFWYNKLNMGRDTSRSQVILIGSPSNNPEYPFQFSNRMYMGIQFISGGKDYLDYYEQPGYENEYWYDCWWGMIFPILSPRCTAPKCFHIEHGGANKDTARWCGDQESEVFQVSLSGYPASPDSGSIVTVTDTSYLLPDTLPDTVCVAYVRKMCTFEFATHTDTVWGDWSAPIVVAGDTTGLGIDTTGSGIDTTGTGGDTLSIARADLQQGIILTPNPASGTVTVRSAERMTEIEVLDIVGNKMMTHKASGLTTKLDVATLPRGTYIVRIHTPMGTASRKLILK